MDLEIKKKLNSFINSLENRKITLPLACITFLAIVFTRAFIEGIFERSHTIGLHPTTEISIYNYFLHFPVYYLFVFLASLLYLSMITKERIEKIGKILLSFFLIILIPPILDLLITPGKGDSLFYFMELKHATRALYGTFIPTMVLKGVSYGLRIEVLIGCILAAIYVLVKTKKWYKSFLSFIGIYVILIFSGALPVLTAKILSLFQILDSSPYITIFRSGGLIATETQRVTLITLLPLLILGPLSFYLWSPEKFRACFRSLKYLLSLHFIGMLLLGFLLALSMSRFAGIQFITNPLDYFSIFALVISISLAYAGIALFERASDAFLVPEGVKNNLTTGELIVMGSLFFAGALIFAISISYVCFLLIGAFGLIFFFYLSPPFRLKRLFPISTFLLSLASLIAVILGFSLFTGEKAAFIFPSRISLLILTVFTLAFSLKDLKTMAQDKKMRMFTIPIIAGEKRGKIIIAFILFISFLIVPFILRDYILVIPAFLLGSGTASVILRKRLRKEIIAVFYIAFALLVLISLWKNTTYMTQNNHSSFLASREYYSANSYFEKGMTDKALTLYESVLKKGYESADLHRRIGLLYLKKGNIKESILTLKNSLAMEGDSPETKLLLAQAYVRAGKADSALLICSNAIQDGRYKAEFSMLQGEAFIFRKDIHKALDAYKRSILLGGSNGNSLIALGNIYLSLNSLDKAISCYTRALNLNKGSQVLRQRAEAYYRKKALDNALSDLVNASLIDPADPEIRNNIAILHYQKGNFRKAEAYFTRAIALDNEYLAAYENLTDTYEKMGRHQDAALVRVKIKEIKRAKMNKKS